VTNAAAAVVPCHHPAAPRTTVRQPAHAWFLSSTNERQNVSNAFAAVVVVDAADFNRDYTS